jgi:hypothetical protein
LIGHLDPRNQRFLTGEGPWPVKGHTAALAWINRLFDVERNANAEAAKRLSEEGQQRNEAERRVFEEAVLHQRYQERSRPL